MLPRVILYMKEDTTEITQKVIDDTMPSKISPNE
ncbi:MAG: hypothetical protein Ct9H300mP28_09730 [Pseudomonadota bacterium]|nr:MAG: hypothetical protein Ct9H300mP28_09730 [Pseudomonadota bacterium]